MNLQKSFFLPGIGRDMATMPGQMDHQSARGYPHIVLARFAFEQKSQSPFVNTTEGTHCYTTTFDVSWMHSVI